jgi:predicted glycosyltransferase
MKKTIVFMVTNGAGLGHLTRGLAVAKRLRELDNTLEVVFFSTSLATEVIRNEGFMFYYIPTKSLMPETVTAVKWNEYMKSMLQQIIDIYDPAAIIFDGAYPYGGVISSLRQNDTLKSIWIKREGDKSNSLKREELEKEFDLIVVPREAVRSYSDDLGETTKVKHCNPIILIDRSEAYERAIVRKELGVDEGNNLFYVQLGAGNINDIKAHYNLIIECILKNPNHMVLLGESIIGEKVCIKDKRVKIVRSYPNARYFKAIDFAVSAVGYNTFHELLYFRVPSLFVPNLNTVHDDQVKRAQLAEEKGAALCLEEVEEKSLECAIEYMCRRKEKMKRNLQKIHQKNGAEQAAKYILEEVFKSSVK